MKKSLEIFLWEMFHCREKKQLYSYVPVKKYSIKFFDLESWILLYFFNEESHIIKRRNFFQPKGLM